MIRATMLRVLPLVERPENIFIATGKATEQATRELVPEVPAENFLVEPVARNTAPCIAWAAELIGRKNPEDVVVVLPSDHHVSDEEEFRRLLGVAVAAAREGRIVTIGIKPTRPDTGFGYIQLEQSARFSSGAPVEPQDVVRFVEKPNRGLAEEFLLGGKHLWNAGMFIFKAGVMMAAVRKHLPDAGPLLERITQAPPAAAAAELEQAFPLMPAVSIDVGVMEREQGLLVVPGDFGWSDVGSWQAAWELADKTEEGNTRLDGLVAIDSRDNHVVLRGGKRVVALLGVEGLAVVETADALLIMPLEKAQDVRSIVEALKKSNPELL
jgi:mannose-1-phosphate guanylyltransferase